MTDTTLGYALIALGILFVLALVFAATMRDGRPATRSRVVGVDADAYEGDEDAVAEVHPPAGVHLPPPSWLPVLISVAAAILAVGLTISAWALVPGLIVLVAGALGWYRAANREWRGVAQGEGHDGRGHE